MSNFAFLARHDALLAELGARAEEYALSDPNTSLVKLRQFLERFVAVLADLHRWGFTEDDSLHFRLKYAERQGWLEKAASSYAHKVRIAGNHAVHELQTSVGRAVEQLRNARRLAIWFEANFGDPDFHAGRFTPPSPPADASADLQASLDRQAALEAELEATLAAGAEARAALTARLEAQARRLSRPHVGLHQSIAAALDDLPFGNAEARAALHRFRGEADPDALEPFADDVDPLLRWTPLTDDHLLVVAVAPDLSVLLAVWLGDEDGATDWARTHRVEVHPVTRNLQVFRTDAPVAGRGGLLGAHDDDALLACGVPPLLLPAVRALDDRTGLDDLGRFLPDEATEALQSLLDGVPLPDVQAEAGLTLAHPDEATADFATALSHPASQRRFVEVVDDEALAAVLDAPLSTWRTFLHPSQQRVVQMRANGPIRVLGGAGTGKTVALLHRAALLARERFTAPDDRLLVTTFTRTLADELATMVREFAPDVADRIEVLSLHRFARRFLVRHGQRVFEAPSDSQRRRIFSAASRAHDPQGSLSLDFLVAEWREVLVRFGLRERDDYLRAPRPGRGSRIGRRQKALAWTVLAAARAALEEEGLAEPDRLAHDAARFLTAHPELVQHRAVLADEVQDFGVDALRLLRAAVPRGPDDLFLVGDGHQRLYGAPVTLSSCGISIRGRSARLRLNYRTTESIRRVAHAALGEHVADDLDGGVDSLHGYRSLRDGPVPQWEWHDDRASSQERIADLIDEWAQEVDASSLCVAAATRKEVERIGELLTARGLDVAPLDRSPRPGVRLSTFHRLKGTEFRRVVLASVCAGGLPHTGPSWRCLLYVAASRARDRLVLSGWGAPSPILAPLESP